MDVLFILIFLIAFVLFHSALSASESQGLKASSTAPKASLSSTQAILQQLQQQQQTPQTAGTQPGSQPLTARYSPLALYTGGTPYYTQSYLNYLRGAQGSSTRPSRYGITNRLRNFMTTFFRRDPNKPFYSPTSLYAYKPDKDMAGSAFSPMTVDAGGKGLYFNQPGYRPVYLSPYQISKYYKPLTSSQSTYLAAQATRSSPKLANSLSSMRSSGYKSAASSFGSSGIGKDSTKSAYSSSYPAVYNGFRPV